MQLPDQDRKTQLQAALLLLLGMNSVLPRTAPGQAPLHVAYVNTYLALGPNQKQVRASLPLQHRCWYVQHRYVVGCTGTLLVGVRAGLGKPGAGACRLQALTRAARVARVCVNWRWRAPRPA